MAKMPVIWVLSLLLVFAAWQPEALAEGNSCSASTLDARLFFERENELLRQRYHEEYLASYTYNTNVTDENRQAMIAVYARNAVQNKQLAEKIKSSDYTQSEDADVRRQALHLSKMGASALDPDDYLALQNAISSMQSNYATTNVCSYTNRSDCSLSLEPHIQERLSNSRDPAELAWYWREWHDKAGTTQKDNFAEYVRLTRKAARLNDHRSYADYWVQFYEDADFERQLDASFKQLLPFYRQIHGYVRYRLRQHYGEDVVPAEGNIPMHLLGNMWGQSWNEVIDLFTPYPEKPFVDIKASMVQQNYTVQKLFELGDQYFQSLGMRALPPSFWNLSLLTRPDDRQVVCHASAWDFYQDSDVRIKMCTEVDMHYFFVVHHELGHIQYYLQYEQQPAVFRGAPNPGFHEAVGDVIALSVMSAKHLKTIGLTDSGRLDEKSRINELFKQALSKIVFLPFGYTMDKYRYAVFRNEIEEPQWNCGFWQMRSEYGGVEPPVPRTDKDFDPPAKYHIDADVEYLRYFAAHIFQFQFHKALCSLAGQYAPNDSRRTLDNCDIFGSKEAGRALSKFLSHGSSLHWKVVLQEFTGETEMDTSALLEYFDPLYQWLKQENSRLGVPLGWGETNKIPSDCCGQFST
ncbi:angiotensin-converting enzyme-related protein isoform X1 [Drosophila subobscura]|uniref:angiotensin-converting enzyme-related protein isoform X1 n=1 Tax=Drosophila subobscura TaxID=7241 RepID=UPI00155A11F9|nr:angiotensin-converting enzyme-related protein isoform X1 [Drosophila subobscura]XP_034666458.1 angiotensin-converting enzyme-related protein isoform X1 [Drosophila subobscura]XP_034666460.1 angiotensin-converting enzyme-related protein isoform X1 [Drosophila subobscura]